MTWRTKQKWAFWGAQLLVLALLGMALVQGPVEKERPASVTNAPTFSFSPVK